MRNRLLATAALGFAVAATPAFATGPANPYASPVTAPNGVLWLPDTLTAAKGHWWFTDHLRGLCRLDPVSGPPQLVAADKKPP